MHAAPRPFEVISRSCPPAARAAIARVREIVNANLPAGFEDGVQYGMISWYVPRSRFPDTYNSQPLAIASLASHKRYMVLYLMSVYGDPELAAWLRGAFARAGKKLDMGKSCVRFTSIDALPLEVIGETIRRARSTRSSRSTRTRAPSGRAKTIGHQRPCSGWRVRASAATTSVLTGISPPHPYGASRTGLPVRIFPWWF